MRNYAGEHCCRCMVNRVMCICDVYVCVCIGICWCIHECMYVCMRVYTCGVKIWYMCKDG